MAARKMAEFMIVNRRSGKALQASGGENGAVVEQAAPTGSSAQLWTTVEAGDSVKLVNQETGKVLDVMTGGTENGTWAQIWEDVNGESQLWRVVKVTATYQKILNVQAGKVLDVMDMSEEDGAPAQIWEDVNGEGQQWKLVSPAAKTAKKAPAKKTAKTEAVKKAPAKKAGKASGSKAEPKKAAVKKAPAKTAPKQEGAVQADSPKTAAKPKASTVSAKKTTEKK